MVFFWSVHPSDWCNLSPTCLIEIRKSAFKSNVKRKYIFPLLVNNLRENRTSALEPNRCISAENSYQICFRAQMFLDQLIRSTDHCTTTFTVPATNEDFPLDEMALDNYTVRPPAPDCCEISYRCVYGVEGNDVQVALSTPVNETSHIQCAMMGPAYALCSYPTPFLVLKCHLFVLVSFRSV